MLRLVPLKSVMQTGSALPTAALLAVAEILTLCARMIRTSVKSAPSMTIVIQGAVTTINAHHIGLVMLKS